MKRSDGEMVITLPKATSKALGESVRLLCEKMGCEIVTPATFGPEDGFATVKKGDYEFVLAWFPESGLTVGVRSRVLEQLKEETVELLRQLRAT